MKFDSKIIPYAGWEMFFMRAFFGLAVWMGSPVFLPYTSQPHPNGLAHFIDFTALASPEFFGPLRALLLIAIVFYVIRVWTLPALTVMFGMVVAAGSLENSQGAINHTFQCYGLVILGQWLVSAWSTAKGSAARVFDPIDSLSLQRLGIHAAKVALVASYVTSAITKLIESEGGWIFRTVNLAPQIVKSNANSYVNALVEPGWLAGAAPEFIVHNPVISSILISGGLFLELFAFLALLGRWQAAIYGILLISMHEMIAHVMNLHFPTFQNLCLIFLVNIPFLVCLTIRGALRLRPRAA